MLQGEDEARIIKTRVSNIAPQPNKYKAPLQVLAVVAAKVKKLKL